MTPIQEVIQWAETRDMRDYPNKYAFRQGIVTKLKQALEKEKEQINQIVRDVFEHCWNHPNWIGGYDIKDMNDYLKTLNK